MSVAKSPEGELGRCDIRGCEGGAVVRLFEPLLREAVDLCAKHSAINSHSGRDHA